MKTVKTILKQKTGTLLQKVQQLEMFLSFC